MSDIKTSPSDNSSVNDESMLSAPVPYEDSNASESPFSPIIIGLYGILGAGKSFLLHHMNENPDLQNLTFIEGSEMLSDCTVGGVEAFKQLSVPEKEAVRRQATGRIQDEAFETQKHIVVAGHLSFWSEEQNACDYVYTEDDMDIFTHIFYVHVPAAKIYERRSKDSRDRG
jgi:hypothetical protein